MNCKLKPGLKLHNKGFALSFVLKVRFYTHFKSCHPLGVKKGFVKAQAAQAHYLWVRASEVIWWEYTRIISVLSDAK